eukprot:2294303-Amphidinium_carterae.1
MVLIMHLNEPTSRLKPLLDHSPVRVASARLQPRTISSRTCLFNTRCMNESKICPWPAEVSIVPGSVARTPKPPERPDVW